MARQAAVGISTKKSANNQNRTVNNKNDIIKVREDFDVSAFMENIHKQNT